MPKTDPTRFSNFELDWSPLRRIRRSLDMSQTDLARAVGVHRETIGRIERGVMDPSFRTVVAITKAMGTRQREVLPLAQQEGHVIELWHFYNVVEPA